jgi:hypothetical protein
MVGLPPGDGYMVTQKLLENKTITVTHQKISTTDVTEILKQTAYFRKMQSIEAKREKASAGAG